MLNFVVRALLFVIGLVFAASLACAVLLLMALWGVRYGWARLLGRPVRPWVMRFDPRSGFDRFRAAAQPVEPSAADVAAARARGHEADSPVRLRDPSRVSDVQARPLRRD